MVTKNRFLLHDLRGLNMRVVYLEQKCRENEMGRGRECCFVKRFEKRMRTDESLVNGRGREGNGETLFRGNNYRKKCVFHI